MKAILLLYLLAFGFSFGGFGKWEKASLGENSIYVDMTIKAGEKEIFSVNKLSNEKVQSYPIEIYKQIVNGFNYKILFATYDTENGDTDLYQAVIGFSPFSERQITNQILSSEKLSPSSLGTKPSKLEDIKKAITKTNTDALNLVVLKEYKDVMIKGAHAFIVKSEEEKKVYVVFEDEEGNITVDQKIKLI